MTAPTAQESLFLSVQDVLRIHDNTIAHEGGASGLRDIGLLESAVAMPQQGFGPQLLHPDVLSQAAAYLFHLVSNHPFVDGNKRVGLQACQVFLFVNRYSQPPPKPALDMTLAVARGEVGKAELTDWLRGCCGPL